MTIFTVWTPATLIAAIVAGLGMGYFIIGRYTADPTWASVSATAKRMGLLVAGLGILSGLVFYIGQTTATAAEGGPWERVISRCGLWVVYAVFQGIGTWRRLHSHILERKAAALEQAKRELEQR